MEEKSESFDDELWDEEEKVAKSNEIEADDLLNLFSQERIEMGELSRIVSEEIIDAVPNSQDEPVSNKGGNSKKTTDWSGNDHWIGLGGEKSK